MADALLRVDNLVLKAGERFIVKDFSFEVHPGEIVALTGKSGSGKTSIALGLLRFLPTGIHFQSGTVTWNDGSKKLSLPGDEHQWDQLRGNAIGYVQQDIFGAFDPVQPMGKQMLLFINEKRPHLDPPAKQTLKGLLEEVGLGDVSRLMQSYPHQLSGGQLQRCMMAMMLVVKPALIILDEPTSAIDKMNQVELLDVLKRLRKSYGLAILCITHEEDVVNRLADRVVHLGHSTVDAKNDVEERSGQENIAASALLEITGLGYTHMYGGLSARTGAAVTDVHLQVYAGQGLGIVGESGSGKSTLAQLLVGLLTPHHGTIKVQGGEINLHRKEDVSKLRAKVQLVMQDGRGSLHPYLPVVRALSEACRHLNMEESGQRNLMTALLREVELDESVLDRKPGQLSGGECLRVNIARALLMSPAVLICDESTSALDSDTRDAIIRLLQTLKQSRQMGLVIISHDIQVIRKLTGKVLVMADGAIVEQGATADLLQYPTHPVSRKIFAAHATLT